jgi:hypothetical protein
VDVIVQVDKGKATSTGRFNAGGSMEIWFVISIPLKINYKNASSDKSVNTFFCT